MFAKRFFFVCAGMFLLALSYHLGARSAMAQATSFRVLGPYAALVGNTAYVLNGDTSNNYPIGWLALPYGHHTLPPVAPSSLVAWGFGWAITDSGEGWYRLGETWISIGYLSGATAAQRETWGALKSRYRGERGAAESERR